MKPLTIEELKALEVEDWVWIVNIYREDTSYAQKVYDNEFDKFHFNSVDDEYYLSDYDTRWLAYKNKEQAEAKGEIVELPFKAGDDVWVVDYDEDVVSYVCVGGNSDFLFLSPTIYAGKDLTTPKELCNYFVDCYMEDGDDADIVIFPHNKCFKTKSEAERRLAELKGEE